MDKQNLNNLVDKFLDINDKNLSNDTKEICDTKTGECYTIKTKDGIVERINKKFITDDGRQLLQD